MIVKISFCEPPHDSYWNVFEQFNISGIQSLMLDLPETASSFTRNHFVGLVNITSLKIIKSSPTALTYFSDGCLTPLTKLDVLYIDGNVSLPILPPENQIQKVFIRHGQSRGELGECSHLLELTVSVWTWSTTSKTPPPRWLAGCHKLQSLVLINIMMDLWPQDGVSTTLAGLTALRTLTISNCNLKSISPGFLDDAINLVSLDLSKNELLKLPSGALLPVASTLHTLMLQDNPSLSGFCSNDDDYDSDDDDYDDAADDTSGLLSLHSLRELSLGHTGVRRICPSWSRHLTSIMKGFRDIKWLGARTSALEMWANRVDSIMYTMNDYLEVTRDNCTKFNVSIGISKQIICDCHSYWFARTLAECPEHVTWMIALRCSTGEHVADVSLKSMLCSRHADECAPDCECYWRERRNATIANCSSVVDGRIPLIPHLYELNASSSRIDDLSKLPSTLIYADLRYNQLPRMSEEAAEELFSVPERRLRFAGNPIVCDCGNSPFIEALQQHRNQVLDYDELTCIDDRIIDSIVIEELCALSSTLILVYGLTPVVVLLLFILLVFGVFSRHQETVKIYLYARRWCLCCIREHHIDQHKEYDAFVSYSHADEQFVYEHLIPQLEGEPHCFRLCVHTRDWVIGEWIPVQIAHSVDESRRTIILLSQNFLESVWGRLEFRTAHKRAMSEGLSRVIVVLLEDVGDHPNLDKELKAYLTTNTYVKWGDPHFWEKLRSALPQRRNEREARRAGEEVALELLRMEERRPPAICAPPASSNT
ncbi:protein toll-like [Achroia grisella]|uniref:protein toll-like n=1 Tax=Achroia grisella TaxID=688607 RepID=UPI0027D2522A|nr:protein toll-like [Achroia grisella]